MAIVWFNEMGREILVLTALLLVTAAQTVLNSPLLDVALMAAWFGVFLHGLARLVRGNATQRRRLRWALLLGVVLLVGVRVASAADGENTAKVLDLPTQISVALLSLGVFIGAVNQTVDLIIKPFVNASIPATPEMDYWRGWLLRGVAALIGVLAAFLMQFNVFGFVHQVYPQIPDNLLIILTGSTAALGSQGLHRVSALLKQLIGIWTAPPTGDALTVTTR